MRREVKSGAYYFMAINILDSITASRIAAGEVIERPASVIRELIDNAHDAKASKISVYINEGGISEINIIDNGCGIDHDDLEKTCHSHATSKIKCADDIFSLKTIGFRGEALWSIASCSCLTIQSNGYSKTVDNMSESDIVPCSIKRGTHVCVKDIFSLLPARRLFLKRPSSEATECKKIFIEKALCFEDSEMIFYNDGSMDLQFKASDRFTRAKDVMSYDKQFDRVSSVCMEEKYEQFNLCAVSSSKDCFRRDRTQIRIIVNNHLIDCYQLVQAVTSSYSVVLPGGSFPYFTLYIDIDPTLVDFNVHPAKRECRIRNIAQVHSAVTAMIRKNLLAEAEQQSNEIRQQTLIDTENVKPKEEQEYSPHIVKHIIPDNKTVTFKQDWFDRAKSVLSETTKTTQSDSVMECNTEITEEYANKTPSYKYIGQIFNKYLVVQTSSSFLFIDQHAAHERILYDEISECNDIQQLIIPYKFETDNSVDEYLDTNSAIYQDYGIQLIKKEKMLWEITSMPAACRCCEDKIAKYIMTATGDIEEVKKGLFAVIACHAAIKAGDVVDSYTAKKIIDKTLSINAMVCPHGRSFVYSVSEKDLDKFVGRTL